MFEFVPLIDAAAHFGVQAKAVLVDPALRGWRRRLCRDGLQAQYFLARPRPKRDAIGAGGRLQGPERGFRSEVGQGGHPLLFNEITLPFRDPDLFHQLAFPSVLDAKRAIADHLGIALAKLPPAQLEALNALLLTTLAKEAVFDYVRRHIEP